MNSKTEELMQQLEQPYEGAEMKPLYTAVVTVTPGSEGHARMSGHAKSADGLLTLDLAMPQELGGSGQRTNPEQLFAAPLQVFRKQHSNIKHQGISSTKRL